MAENSLWAREINGDDDEEEALRIAIAMSLGEEVPERQKPKSKPAKDQRPIDLTQDDIETASEASPEPESVAARGGSRPPAREEATTADPTAPPPPPAGGMAMLGLDRKKMEEERLARLGKRKAADELGSGQDSTRRPTQRLKTDHALPVDMPHLLPKSNMTSAPSSSRPLPNTKLTSAPSASHPASNDKKTAVSSKLPFPKGVVKKTWCHGQPRLGDDIKIEEVLQKDRLELAVISSFQWDPDFLVSKIDLSKTRICLIAYAPDEAEVSLPWPVLTSPRCRLIRALF